MIERKIMLHRKRKYTRD